MRSKSFRCHNSILCSMLVLSPATYAQDATPSPASTPNASTHDKVTTEAQAAQDSAVAQPAPTPEPNFLTQETVHPLLTSPTSGRRESLPALLRLSCSSSALDQTREVSQFSITFWCLFGVYYGRALERGEGIRETKEKSSKWIGDRYLRASSVLPIV
jgi:hypothetical protein